MPDRPNILVDEPLSLLVYEAEDEWLAGLPDEIALDIHPHEVEDFVRDVLAGAGWETDAAPEVLFDVSRDSEYAGWYEAATGTLHFDPEVLDRHKILHELAHSLRRDGHGPQWAGVFISITKAGLGATAAYALVDAFEQMGINWDASWADLDTHER